MTAIERCQFWLAQALDHGKDGSIDEADSQVGVGSHQLAGPHMVLRVQRKDIQLAALDGIQQRREGIGSNLASEEVAGIRKSPTQASW